MSIKLQPIWLSKKLHLTKWVVVLLTLERSVQGGTRAEDKEFVVLIELLTMEMLKLDEIEADGELRVQRKREVSLRVT